MILARSDASANFSKACINAYVMVMPGNRSFPRCVRGMEWPPRRATRERSSSNLSTSQSTPGPDSQHRTLATSGFLAPPLRVSATNMSLVSLMPLAFWVFVSEPLMPLVALVELPPQKGLLSTRRHFPPCSTTVCAAEKPARPPPTTMACAAGKTHAPVAGVVIARPAGRDQEEEKGTEGRRRLRASGLSR